MEKKELISQIFKILLLYEDAIAQQDGMTKENYIGYLDRLYVFWLGVGNSRLYVIGVYDSMGNTLEAFKAYLAENPLILVYPLATSTDFTFRSARSPLQHSSVRTGISSERNSSTE